jgi:hypothetical protein
MTSISTNRRTIFLESAEPREEDQFNFAIRDFMNFHGKIASGAGEFHESF